MIRPDPAAPSGPLRFAASRPGPRGRTVVLCRVEGMMTRMISYLAAALVALIAAPAVAGDIEISDAYARVSGAGGAAGAVFMVIDNHGTTDDRLAGVRSDHAARVELHSHDEDADGVMRMREIAQGIVIPAGGTRTLARGGDHVMLLGLTEPVSDGDVIALTLQFDAAGEVALDVPVDSARAAQHDTDHAP